MSFGFGVADLKGVLKLSKWLWDNHFDKNNTADERYDRLGRSIANLRVQIVRLHDGAASALDNCDPYSPDNDALKTESIGVVGDFMTTIQKCEKLLKQHVKLEKNRAGFITNVVWGVKVKDEVDELTQQLQSHAQRLSLVVEPVKFSVLQELQESVAELVERSRRQDPELRAQSSDLVPKWLYDVFEASLTINTPRTVRSTSDLSVKEGCDLLHHHFSDRRSDSSSRGRAAAVAHYLQLLKCQWIISTLRKSREYPSQRYSSAFPRFISNVEIQIYRDLETIRRTPRAEVSEKELRELLSKRKDLFLIWDPPVARPIVSVDHKEEDEERIARVSLASHGNHKEGLVIFRKGTTSFRLVPTFEMDGEMKPSPYFRPGAFRLRNDTFFARYAVDAHPTIELYTEDSRVPITYELKDTEDALALQHALTGYEVICFQRNVKWSAQRGVRPTKLQFSSSSRTDQLRGCAQIWRWSPLLEAVHPDERSVRTSEESPRLPKGNTSSPSLQEGLSYTASDKESASPSSPTGSASVASRPSSIAPSQRTASAASFVTRRDTKSGKTKRVDLQPPKSPALVFLGYANNNYTCYYLELTTDLFIDRSACACTNEGDGGDCNVLVIQHPKRKRFEIRQLSVCDTEDARKDWNLGAFITATSPAKTSRQDVITSADYKHLLLSFPTAAERKQFSQEFDRTTDTYYNEIVKYHQDRGKLTQTSERPEQLSQNTSSVYDLSSARSSVVSTLGVFEHEITAYNHRTTRTATLAGARLILSAQSVPNLTPSAFLSAFTA
ncbi:hypothetical protein OQA88_11684 [Cercophora sp. LCS_1]